MDLVIGVFSSVSFGEWINRTVSTILPFAKRTDDNKIYSTVNKKIEGILSKYVNRIDTENEIEKKVKAKVKKICLDAVDEDSSNNDEVNKLIKEIIKREIKKILSKEDENEAQNNNTDR